jgi:MarR family transcriptional regulator, 2-MHQ and catechol-resistance regulon repressor
MGTREEDEANLDLLHALGRATQGMRQRAATVFAADGVTGGQFDALGVLYHFGPLCVHDLLEKTVTTSGNIDVVLDNLISKGMVTKVVDPSDHRRRIVTLTEKGRSHMEKRFPQYIGELRRQMGVLTLPDKRKLERLLDRLCDTRMAAGTGPARARGAYKE